MRATKKDAEALAGLVKTVWSEHAEAVKQALSDIMPHRQSFLNVWDLNTSRPLTTHIKTMPTGTPS